MNPPTEQLVRDYLNRVSVAARGKLGSAERREFLARMRESIERQAGGQGTADLVDVGRLLSGLGEPRALVERERARLAKLRGQPGPVAPRSGHLAARPPAWMPRISASRGAEVVVPPDPVLRPASEAPLADEARIQSRPITARRRPGEPIEPRPSGPHRPPWTGNGAEHPDRQAARVSGADADAADSRVQAAGGAGNETRHTGVYAALDLPSGSQGWPAPAGPPRAPVAAADLAGPAPDHPAGPAPDNLAGPAPDDPQASPGPRRWPSRSPALSPSRRAEWPRSGPS